MDTSIYVDSRWLLKRLQVLAGPLGDGRRAWTALSEVLTQLELDTVWTMNGAHRSLRADLEIVLNLGIGDMSLPVPSPDLFIDALVSSYGDPDGRARRGPAPQAAVEALRTLACVAASCQDLVATSARHALTSMDEHWLPRADDRVFAECVALLDDEKHEWLAAAMAKSGRLLQPVQRAAIAGRWCELWAAGGRRSMTLLAAAVIAELTPDQIASAMAVAEFSAAPASSLYVAGAAAADHQAWWAWEAAIRELIRLAMADQDDGRRRSAMNMAMALALKTRNCAVRAPVVAALRAAGHLFGPAVEREIGHHFRRDP